MGPNSDLQLLVKVKALYQVLLGLIQDRYFHGSLARIADLAVSQSVK
jgi:hypothetical protein